MKLGKLWLLCIVLSLSFLTHAQDNTRAGILAAVRTAAGKLGVRPNETSLRLSPAPAGQAGEVYCIAMEVTAAKSFLLCAGAAPAHRNDTIIVESIQMPGEQAFFAFGEVSAPRLMERARWLSLMAPYDRRQGRVALLVNEEVEKRYRPTILEELRITYPDARMVNVPVLTGCENYVSWCATFQSVHPFVLRKGTVLIPQGCRLLVSGRICRTPALPNWEPTLQEDWVFLKAP